MSSASQLTVRLVGQTVVVSMMMGTLLFVPAQSMAWPEAWIFLVGMAGVSLGMGLWLIKRDPGLAAERLRSPIRRGQRAWDLAFMAAVMTLFIGWMLVMGFERRWGPPAWPVWVEAIGAALGAACMVVGWFTFRENSFAAGVVSVQAERGHRVISTGPYAVVRHPLYAGSALWLIGTPLLLGARWGLAVGVAILVLVAVRSLPEERTLARELTGYAAYMAKVRWRLLPGVW